MFIKINEFFYNINNIVRYRLMDGNLTLYLLDGDSVLIYSPSVEILNILKDLNYESNRNFEKIPSKEISTQYGSGNSR